MKKAVVGRFAPSPSGYMHMGNLLAMLLAWLDCRAHNGEMVFRMEDLDPARSRPAYIDALAEDLGLDWDRGWPEAGYAQSTRGSIYEEAFDALLRQDLVYPCWCSRAERLAAASAPHPGEQEHDRRCRCARLSPAEQQAMRNSSRPCAWKLRCPDQSITVLDGHYGPFTQNPARDVGDCIVRRADGVFAYQLAVSVDDMLMGVTRVVRGRDLLDSSPRQKWLIETLGGAAPDYCHTPLLTEGERKLSKRFGSLSTQELRQRVTPEQLVGTLAHICGLLDRCEPIAARELIPLFSWDKITLEDILFEAERPL